MHCCASAALNFIPLELVELQCTVSKAFVHLSPNIDIHVRDSVYDVCVCVCTCRVGV